MLTLGLDCATWTASVGLMDGDEVTAETTRRISGSHAAHLLEMIEQTLEAGGCRLGKVDLIAVSLGPGSFTGLRICLSTAKGLAMVAGASLVGVSTLEALATVASAAHGGEICPVLDARKGEVYAASFAVAAGRVTRLKDDRAVAPSDLAAHVSRNCTLVGEGVDAYRSVWRELLPEAILVPGAELSPSGAVVARLGQESWRRGGGGDIAALEPRYCRKSEAEIHFGR